MSPRIKAKSFTTREQFDAAVDLIATLQVSLRSAEAERDAEIQAVRDDHAEVIDDLKARLEAQAVLAEKYAEEHRGELLPAGRKSAETALATFGWRTGNPTLVLASKKWSWEAVLTAVKELFPGRFVRTVEEVDKEAIKTQLGPDQLPLVGVKISQKEPFFIEAKEQPSAAKAA